MSSSWPFDKDESAVREAITEELASVLSIQPAAIDPARTFDEYGLDSADAIVVVGLIEERLGIELPAELLLQYRSVDEVIAGLAHGAGDKAAAEAEAGAPRVFLFPGGGGHLVGRQMALFRSRAEGRIDLEVVRAGGWREWVEQGRTFQQLIDHASSQIVERGWEGRLNLAGYSQGGQLAFVTAVALARAGYQVNSVALFDTKWSPVGNPPVGAASRGSLFPSRAGTVETIKVLVRSIRARLRGAKGHSEQGGVRMKIAWSIWRRCRNLDQVRSGLQLAAGRGAFLFKGPGGIRLDQAIQMLMLFELWRVWCRENPEITAPFPVILFRSEDPGPEDYGWRQSCAELALVQVKGAHNSMFDAENIESTFQPFIARLRTP